MLTSKAWPLSLLSTASLPMAWAVRYGYNQKPLDVESDPVAAHFPDLADAELLSPAFTEPGSVPAEFAAGKAGPTPNEVVNDFLQRLAARNDWIDYCGANLTSEEHRVIPYVRLSSSPNIAAKPKVRVWLQAGVHGNEPGGDQATLALLGALDANQTWARALLERLDVLVLPRYNPDGVFYFQRALATNYDPNRDHINLERAQTRHVKALFTAFKPHIAVDMHEFTAMRPFGRYVHGVDGFFSDAKNLNIHRDIRTLTGHLFIPRVHEATHARGLRIEPYVTGRSSTKLDFNVSFREAGSDANTGRNAMGLTQCLAFLVETRGIGIGDRHFRRRAFTGLTVAATVLQTAADHADLVLKTVKHAVNSLVSSTDDIVVTDFSRLERRVFSFVDRNNGSLVKKHVAFHSSSPVAANLTRSRPVAYVIPAAWADVAERLAATGVEVEKLDAPWSGTVEAFVIKTATPGRRLTYGTVPTHVTTELIARKLSLPAGSFRIDKRARCVALAFMALEPESTSSYVSMNIVPATAGDELPIFRVPEGTG